MPYLLRRLLYLPLSLLLLSVLCFAFTRAAPGDPVERRMSSEAARSLSQDPGVYLQNYRRLAREMGYDLPPFYFTVTNAAIPDTLHRIVVAEHRATARALAHHFGNWPEVQDYFRRVQSISLGLPGTDGQLVSTARRLLLRADPQYVERALRQLPPASAAPLTAPYLAMREAATPCRVLLPRIYWNGLENQYHRYLMNLLRGEWGVSYSDRRPVAGKISVTLPRTLLLNGLALLVVYLFAVPLGLYMAQYRDSRFDRWATGLTFLAYGVPGFWVATLLANFFTTPAFGMDYFPSMGFGEVPAGAGWLQVARIRAAHLFLPVLCLAYPSFAYVSRHLRTAALTELRQPYVRTARMKGLSGSRVLWKHVFRNASFPLVTMLGGLLPALLAGSVLIEKIFNLPGMGQLLYNAALARDWPVVTAVVLLNGLLTILGLVLADLGYALLDPRVSLNKPRNR